MLKTRTSSYQFRTQIGTLPREVTNISEWHPPCNQGRKTWGCGHTEERDDVGVIQGCPDDDLLANDLYPRVNSLIPAICTTHFHDFFGCDMLVKRDTLNCNLLASVCALPNFAATTPSHNAFGTLEFTLDHQLRG